RMGIVQTHGVSAGGVIPANSSQAQMSPGGHFSPPAGHGFPTFFSFPAAGGHPGGRSPKRQSKVIPSPTEASVSFLPPPDEQAATRAQAPTATSRPPASNRERARLRVWFMTKDYRQ